jgi:transmembrane protease serine 9
MRAGGHHKNDIALIRASTRVAGVAARINTDAALSAARQLGPGERPFGAAGTAVVSGWGVTSENATSASPVLKKATIPLVSNDTCNSSLNNEVTAGMLCAGEKSGGNNACQGDSGGPLVQPRTVYERTASVQVGIVSWSIGCAEPDKYNVFTRVSVYADWIAKVILKEDDAILDRGFGPGRHGHRPRQQAAAHGGPDSTGRGRHQRAS